MASDMTKQSVKNNNVANHSGTVSLFITVRYETVFLNFNIFILIRNLKETSGFLKKVPNVSQHQLALMFSI